MGAWDPPDSHDRDHHDSWFDYDFDGDGKITPDDDLVGLLIYREAQRQAEGDGEGDTDAGEVLGCLAAGLVVIGIIIAIGLRGQMR